MRYICLIMLMFVSAPSVAEWDTFMRRTVDQDVAIYNQIEATKGIEINGRLYKGGDEIYMDAVGTVRIDGVPVQDPIGAIMPITR